MAVATGANTARPTAANVAASVLVVKVPEMFRGALGAASANSKLFERIRLLFSATAKLCSKDMQSNIVGPGWDGSQRI